jgi:hypothetical protein
MSESELTEHTDSPQAIKNTEPQTPNSGWEFSLGRYVVAVIFGLVAGSLALAILWSVYRSVTTAPIVWGITSAPSNPAALLKRSHIRVCMQHLERLNSEQIKETTSMWHRLRYGHRGHLTLWQEWARNWRQRADRLLQQCFLSDVPRKAGTQLPLAMQHCVQKFEKLNRELQNKSTKIWLPKHHGQRHEIQEWKEWSQNWHQRMNLLLQSCPIYGEAEIGRSFQRAHKRMLDLQIQQEKYLTQFFEHSAEIFRDIRQSIQNLKEELR